MDEYCRWSNVHRCCCCWWFPNLVNVTGYIRLYKFKQVNLPSGAQTFTDLNDTPTTYSGSEGKHLQVTTAGIDFVDIGIGIQSVKVEYATASGIYINPGIVHINDGTNDLYKVQSRFSKQLTGLAASNWYYIYAKPPVSGNYITSSEIEYATVTGTLSYTKMGYYHPTNTSWRCIGTVWSNSNNDIQPFGIFGNIFRVTDGEYISRDLTAGTASTWTTVTLTVPFGNVLVYCQCQGVYVNTAENNCRWKVSSGATSKLFIGTTSNSSSDRTFVDLFVDSNKQGQYMWQLATNNSQYIDVHGYVLPHEIFTGTAMIIAV